jgi:tripartite-type tricarboxylate transporter receptor subunit TctC
MLCLFPPGGPLDTLGRVLGESFQGSLGQPVIVENMAGANASIGTARVARATPKPQVCAAAA